MTFSCLCYSFLKVTLSFKRWGHMRQFIKNAGSRWGVCIPLAWRSRRHTRICFFPPNPLRCLVFSIFMLAVSVGDGERLSLCFRLETWNYKMYDFIKAPSLNHIQRSAEFCSWKHFLQTPLLKNVLNLHRFNFSFLSVWSRKVFKTVFHLYETRTLASLQTFNWSYNEFGLLVCVTLM